jgi:hypothetical protein
MIPKNTLRTDEAQFDLSEIKDFFVNHAHPLIIENMQSNQFLKNLV